MSSIAATSRGHSAVEITRTSKVSGRPRVTNAGAEAVHRGEATGRCGARRCVPRQGAKRRRKDARQSPRFGPDVDEGIGLVLSGQPVFWSQGVGQLTAQLAVEGFPAVFRIQRWMKVVEQWQVSPLTPGFS